MFYVFYMGWHWTRDRYIQFSCSVMPDSLWPHGLQHARLPCPSRHPRACSNSRPSSRWYQSTLQYFVVPFSSCLPSFPASGSFPRSQFFTSDGQSIGVSASASILLMNIQEWFPLGLIDVLGWSKSLFRFFLRMLWNKTELTFWPTQCQQKCGEIISLLRELQLKAPAILWIWGWRAARVGWVGVKGYWELNQSGAKGLQVLPPTFFLIKRTGQRPQERETHEGSSKWSI